MTQLASGRDKTKSRLTEVAAELLRAHGPAGVTTRGVAEAAGVQAPTIYRLFGDKDGLLEAVAEHVLATFVSAKAATVEAAKVDDTDPLEDLRAGWDAQIEFGTANPMLFGFLNDPARGMHSPAVASGLRVLQERVHRVAIAGMLRVSEQRAVDLIRAAGTGTVTTILSTPDEHRDPSLANAMLQAVLAQMLTDRPAPLDNDAMTTTVAFRAVAPTLEGLTDAERQLLTQWLDRAISSVAE